MTLLLAGMYPWNIRIISPLHKIDEKYNPDNYQAISSIIKRYLQYLVQFSDQCLSSVINVAASRCEMHGRSISFNGKLLLELFRWSVSFRQKSVLELRWLTQLISKASAHTYVVFTSHVAESFLVHCNIVSNRFPH